MAMKIPKFLRQLSGWAGVLVLLNYGLVEWLGFDLIAMLTGFFTGAWAIVVPILMTVFGIVLAMNLLKK